MEPGSIVLRMIGGEVRWLMLPGCKLIWPRPSASPNRFRTLVGSLVSAYHAGMRKHTTLDLDMDVVASAAAHLGTHGTGDTVRAALEEVIRARRRARLLELSTDMSLEDLERTREAWDRAGVTGPGT
jgi:Arc/MetJ family transcription regulator